VTDTLNVIFIWIFTFALVVRLIAFQQYYFRDPWNIFDLFVVLTSQIILIMHYAKAGNFGVQMIIVRSLRIGRMLKVIKNAKQINIIFQTLIEAAPSIASLGSLLLLVIFMYTILGMKLFGFANVTNQPSINYYSNFKDFFNSFFLLLRAGTGEGQ
jgi:hypothetical protein